MRRRGRIVTATSALALVAVAALPLLGDAAPSAPTRQASRPTARPQAAAVPRTPGPAMHAVGDGDWIEGEHAEAFHEDAASCQACHGHRLQGTARSRVARRQVFRLPGEGRAPVAFERGEAVSCGACHDAPALPCEAGG